MKRIVVAILFVVVIASQLVAAEPAPFVDNNAALRYLMAIGYMPKLSDKTHDQLSDIDSLEALKKLKPEARKEITSTGFMAPILRFLDLAADCTQSTFIVDQDYNYNSLIPPFRSIRMFARFINAHGWIDAEKGDYVGAAKKFVHVFRLGVNLGKDGASLNAMVGIGVQRLAVESINNLLKLNKSAEARKILNDYFAALAKPVCNSKAYVNNEKRYVENSLILAEKTPDVFAYLELFVDESAKPAAAVSSPEKACAANQRVLMGATEMYMMDYEDVAASIKDSEDFIKRLVDEKYLKSAPVCRNKGNYSINFVDNEDYTVACSCGVSPDSISEPAQEVKEPEFSPELMKKIDDYLKSAAFSNDKKEIAAIFDEMLQIDPYTAEGDAKAGKLAERIENNTSKLVKAIVLNPQSLYKSLRENQQRIDELVETLKK